jgi:hypothetical protein
VQSDLNITANFVSATSPNKTLALAKVGLGTVTSSPAGINCGTQCAGQNAEFSGSSVQLTAAVTTGYSFTGFTGCALGANPCTITMDEPIENVTATFAPQKFPVNVTKGGNGNGLVTSDDGITCGADCSESVDFDKLIVLEAKPGLNSEFVDWGPANDANNPCKDVPPGTTLCQIKVKQTNPIVANFKLKTYKITVEIEGGGGTKPMITSNVGGIACNFMRDDCVAVLNAGTAVVLTAHAPGYRSATAPGWASFAGYSGVECDEGNGAATCSFNLKGDITVGARFKQSGLLAFLTGKVFAGGDLGGVKGADPLCATIANNAGLPGASWAAWLSESRVDAYNRLVAARVATVIRLDGRAVMPSGINGLRGGIAVPLSIDEREVDFSKALNPVPVWTGTLPDGHLNPDDAPYCEDWRSMSGGIPEGVGDARAEDSTWTFQERGIIIDPKGDGAFAGPSGFDGSCFQAARLYCIQNPAL